MGTNAVCKKSIRCHLRSQLRFNTQSMRQIQREYNELVWPIQELKGLLLDIQQQWRIECLVGDRILWGITVLVYKMKRFPDLQGFV